MVNASLRRLAEFKNAAPGSTESHLYSIAFAFRKLQDNRHMADYDLSGTLSSADVTFDIWEVENAFASWELIRHEQVAQDYLFAMLFKDRA